MKENHDKYVKSVVNGENVEISIILGHYEKMLEFLYKHL